MSETKVTVVQAEETPTAAEREEKVLQDAGVDTKIQDGVYKVKLNNTENAIQEQSTESSVLGSDEQSKETGEETQVGLQEVGEGNKEEAEVESLIEEITDETETSNQELDRTVQTESRKDGETNSEILREQEEKIDLPEGIEALVKFMAETGGTMEDYIRLNTDYSNIDDESLLREYYKNKKSHLSNDEINFLIEDNFSYDEELDDERDIRRKKLAYKEAVAEARQFLNNTKDQYYKEVKLGSKLNPEQQKAVEFFNRYNQEQSESQKFQQQQSEHFKKVTDNVFNEEFKGFDFKVGDKKYRYNVKDVQSTKEAQSDVLKTFSNYLDERNMLKDASGYHKALFAARNADALAQHFYEQGKADAIKSLNAESKNINMDPRKTSSGVVDTGGVKVRAISGDDSSKLKIKLRK